MKKKLLVVCLACTLLPFFSVGQKCSNPGQNPASAFPVCGNSATTLTQTSVPTCTGQNIPTPGCSGLSDVNPYWYKFTCYVTGTLGFTITPNNLADDYDWQLFDVTGQNPDDVYVNTSLFVACDWSGFTGVTGATSAGTGLVHCGGNTPIFSAMPTLLAGHDYLLMVSHFTPTQSGYQLVFAGGTAILTDPAGPPVPKLETATPRCDATQVVVQLNKKVRCTSLAANGSDFTIAPAGTIISATGLNCSSDFDLDSVLITFASPLAANTYTLTAQNGNDANTLLDDCGNSLGIGEQANFTIVAQAALPNGTVTPPPCIPTSITLTFADPIKCSSIEPGGSDFSITGPSTVTITSATAVACNGSGETNSVTIQFSAPITVTGTYQVQIKQGSDNNTIIGPCGRQVNVGDVAPFTLAPQLAIAMGSITPPPCAPTSITLNFAEPIDCNSIEALGTDFSITGPSAVTITGATAVACAGGQASSLTIQFAAPIFTSGNYQLQIKKGTDNNTLTGNCGRDVTAGGSAAFTIAPQPPIAMGAVTPPPCIPTSLTLVLADAVFCSSIETTGSDFSITGPSVVTITGAAGVNCNSNGQTNTISLQLAGPILTTGTYQVVANEGSDNNTLAGDCGRQVTIGATAPFTLDAQPPIAMGTIPTQPCSPTTVEIDFTDPLLCNSIAADGSDFTITGASPVTVTGATPVNCTGGMTNAVTLTLSAPVAIDGNYQVQMVKGTDNNTLIGSCNRQTIAGQTAPFVIPVVPPVLMDSLVPIACSPSSLRLIFSAPIRCSSFNANGEEFALSGPSVVTVTGATASCDANGLTSAIDLQLSKPIVVGGNYALQLIAGTDGNTLLSSCYRPSPTGTLNFKTSDTVSAVFQYQVQNGCDSNTVAFINNGGNGINAWNWSVNGTPISIFQSFTKNFSAASSNQVTLAVSNELCKATSTASLVFNNKVTPDFDLPIEACPEDNVTIVNTSKGPIDTWAWDFGNGVTSADKTPAVQQYPLTGTDKNYVIQLTASNADGCIITATKTIKIFGSCFIAVPTAFTPNNDGLNDYLFPINAFKADNLDFKVFDRWGQVVFRTTNWTQKWDGKINGIPQAAGVYVWMLSYTDRDTHKNVFQKGTTLLIR